MTLEPTRLKRRLHAYRWETLSNNLWNQVPLRFNGQTYIYGQLHNHLCVKLGNQPHDQLWDQLWDRLEHHDP